VSRKCRFLNNVTSNHMVTKAVGFKGVTEPSVSVASIRLKALRFDIDPIIRKYPGNITDLGHSEVRRRSATAGKAK
jgi:hypothetical protein